MDFAAQSVVFATGFFSGVAACVGTTVIGIGAAIIWYARSEF